jgi:hypothetical protein
MTRKRFGQKTYGHLEALGRRPSRYDVTTRDLHYYRELGFAVDNPVVGWYRRHQGASGLSCDDWDAFADPEKTTYAAYVKRRSAGERHVDALLADASAAADAALPPNWVDVLDSGYAPLRYPCHGLMMAAAYVGSMAPGGRVTIAAAFQAGDESRRIDRFASRLVQLRRAHPELGDGSLLTWTRHEAWQPLRAVIEQLLVAYEFSEAFVALNLVLKPAFDGLVLGALGEAARRAGDAVSGALLSALSGDAAWHRNWTGALCAHLVASRDANRDVLRRHVEAWGPRVDLAVQSLATVLGVEADAVPVAWRSHLASAGWSEAP